MYVYCLYLYPPRLYEEAGERKGKKNKLGKAPLVPWEEARAIRLFIYKYVYLALCIYMLFLLFMETLWIMDRRTWTLCGETRPMEALTHVRSQRFFDDK
jgi:hypothetical protein